MDTTAQLLARESFFDAAILKHGFTDYMRDYEIVVSGRGEPPLTDVHRYHFVGCVEAAYESAIEPTVMAKSMDDRCVYAGPDHPATVEPDGFIWGVRWANAYPGLTYVEHGVRAAAWSARLGCAMHEVVLETNVYRLRLVFASVRYAFAGHDQRAVLGERDFPLAPHAEPPRKL